jgi:hypothetical protein
MNTAALNQMWHDFVPFVKQTVIVADCDFYTAAADQFTITVVGDETGKCEHPFETVLEELFVKQVISCPEDMIGFFLHVSSHQRCDLFWKTCPTPMDQFTPDQLDFIEEVYNQRLVSIVAPQYYNAFPRINALYDVYKGYDVAKRRSLQTMFTKQSNTGNDTYDTVHTWLYRRDPLNLSTFQQYMNIWSLLIKDPHCAAVIAAYES